MSTQVLSSANAYNPGSDLWCLPDFTHSRWAKKIDWNLNFQFTKSLMHSPLELSLHIQKIMQETEMPTIEKPNLEKSPLMISSHTLLPNRWTLLLPYEKNNPRWVEKINQIYLKLKSPTLRIFLPHKEVAQHFEVEFKKYFPTTDVIVVLDT